MKIAVLVKEVPDTYGERHLDLETGLVLRGGDDQVLDEICERALEVALRYADTHPDTEVTVVSMSPESAAATVRKALAIGAHRALQVVDPGLVGADLGFTAQVLAAALSRVGFDLVIAGNQSTDGSGGVIPAMIAELLDLPHATALRDLEIEPDRVRGTRLEEGAALTVVADLPAVVSVSEAFPDARLANFKGILAAKKKPYEQVSLADLGLDADDHSTARSILIAVAAKPPRQAGTKIVDEGDGGTRLAEFLLQNRLG